MVFIPAPIPLADIRSDGELLIVGRGPVQMVLQLAQTDSFAAAEQK